MKLRRLQVKDEDGQWYDDAYAFEDDTGRVIFRYNLTWERIGSRYNGRLQKNGVSLEQIEPVIPPHDGLRWLPVEIIEEKELASYLAVLDRTCAIPN
jgi:hypothetical protein